MADKPIDAINQVLYNDSTLAGLLGKDSFGNSAVYDSWGEQDREFPYIIITYSFNSSYHFGRREGHLIVDIFTRGADSRKAENIKDRVVILLDKQRLKSDSSGKISLYLTNEDVLPEPEDTSDIIHWKVRFDFYFWRKTFINNLVNT